MNKLSEVPENKRITILGSGNVAWHIGRAFKEKGFNILQVYNRTHKTGQKLAENLSAEYAGSISELKPVDLYLIAVSDDAIEEIAGNAYFNNCSGIVVHTAGSVSIDIFCGKAKNYGVFYPLQTFTKDKEIDLRPIPFLVESNSKENARALTKLASLLSDKVYHVNSDQRMMLHLAGIIGSNFTNHLLSCAARILKKNHLQLDMLQPLLCETLSKAMSMSPEKAQTGPAVRGNRKIIEKHLTLLKPYPDIREIYRIMSESIIKSRT